MVFSGTARYDIPENLENFRRDVRKELVNLPIPQLKPPGNGEVKIAPTPVAVISTQQYPVKAFIAGQGVFTVQIPRNAIPTDRPAANLFLTVDGGCLGIVFAKDGIFAGSTRSEDTVAFRFPRARVPFQYAAVNPLGYKAPVMYARFRGESLVCEQPLSAAILTGHAPVRASGKYSLEDGAEIKKMMNDWLAWAKAEGHAPQLIFEHNRIEIEVAEKIRKKL